MTRDSLAIPLESLTFPLRNAARRFPDKAAVITPEAGGGATTFRALDEQSSALAAALAGAGIEPGDRVALWMKNSLEYILAFYGILKAGAVVVPVSTHYGSREVLHQVNTTRASCLIAQEELIGCLGAPLTGRTSIRVVISAGTDEPAAGAIAFSRLLAGEERIDRSLGIDPRRTLAVLPFSSGTTGLPKGVMLTHANLLSNLYQIVDAHEVSETDLFLNQLPFFHIYGMTVLMGNAILAGATQVVASRFRPLDQFLDLFASYRPTLFFTVPLVVQEFCHHPRVPAMDWSRLRYINTGGAPLAPDLQQRFTHLTGVPVMQGYGLTESSPGTHVNPPGAIRVGTIGIAVANTRDKVVDPATGRELAANEVGELWVRGPQVMEGYYHDPEATELALVDGWLRTGDLARKDADGYVTIVDRLKELIKTKGYQVAPAEIEHILVGHPHIQDAAVIGDPHPEFGEVPVAYVVLRPGSTLSPEAIVAYAAEGVAKYKRLARVVITAAIPRSPSGKILRRVLKESLPATSPGSAAPRGG